MKKIIAVSVLIVFLFIPYILFSQVKVRGYYRKDGTYVQPHYRSAPNHTKLDNWSTKGNVNPYTGKLGTKNVYNEVRTSVHGSGGPSSNRSSYNGPELFFDDDPKVKREREKAFAGDKYAQYNMGSHYFFGEGVKQDFKEALYWYKKSANQGLKNAQYNVGYCYYMGKGTEVDMREAVYWLEKAVENGDVNAEFLLGVCYYEGKGVSKNRSKGIELLRSSNEKGCANAGNYLNKKGISLTKNIQEERDDFKEKSKNYVDLVFRSGVSLSKFRKHNMSNLPRPWLGLFADFIVSDKFGAQLGLMYVTKGAREFENLYNEDNGKGYELMADYDLSYIEMPFVFYDRLRINDYAELRFGIGFYISYAFSGKVSAKLNGEKLDLSFDDLIDDKIIKDIDLGGRVYTGIKVRRWLLTFDYDFGMDISDRDNISKLMGYHCKVKNSSLMLGLGFVF